jgi:glyoxylate utilization-related uncharacterized protein
VPKVSKEGATQGGDYGPVIDRSEDLGGYTVNFLTFRDDIDQTPLLKGAPDDQCQCRHWGYVTKGRLTFRVGDREETFETGDHFYLPAGHVGISNDPETEYVQFSPTRELSEVSDLIMKNMQEKRAT